MVSGRTSLTVAVSLADAWRDGGMGESRYEDEDEDNEC